MHYEAQIELHIMFVDFEQAYDTINKAQLMKVKKNTDKTNANDEDGHR